MMARPCVLALLCVALWCGVVAGQETEAGDDAGSADASAPASPPEPKQPTTTNATTTTTTTTTEAAPATGEASKDENSGAATVGVSLSSLMIATLLAKVYAH